MPDDTLSILYSQPRQSGSIADDAIRLVTPRAIPGVMAPPIIGLPCPVPYPASHPPNDKYLFLHHIGGPTCLRSFLSSLILANKQGNKSHRHWGCTLVIDEVVTLRDTLVLPANFTLAGVGPRASGVLFFEDMVGQPAIVMQEKVDGGFAGYTTIRDIGIDFNFNQPGNVPGPGVLIEGVSDIILQRVGVIGFSPGVVGSAAPQVTIDSCLIHGNQGNIWLNRF